jgi:hypothetical protein
VKNKGLSWFTVLKVSAHDQLVLLLLGCGQAALTVGTCGRTQCSPHDWEVKEQKRKRLDFTIPFKGMPPVT